MMNQNSKKKLLSFILCIVLIAATALLAAGCSDNTAPTDGNVLGKGAISFRFKVVDTDGTETAYEIRTDKTVLADALLELGLITVEPGDPGVIITAVNGITADWETEQAYWAFFVDGEYAQSGADTTEIVAGATYSFVKTVFSE